MWRSLRAYVPAVVRWWWVLVVGTLAAAVGLVVDIRSDFALPGWVWAVFIGAGVMVAQFLAFHDLHGRHQALMQSDATPKPALDVRVQAVGMGDHRLVISNSGAVALHDVTWELPPGTLGWNLMEQGLPKPWPELQPDKQIRIPLALTMPTTPTVRLRLTAIAGGSPHEWSPMLTVYDA